MNALYSSILLNQMLFHLLPVCEGSMQTLIGKTGESVTLPCRYDIKPKGLTDMCWGRGELPLSKCSDTIVSTHGEKVTFRESDRYQLLSGVQEGNVSLTIINVTENDSGIYGCKVEIPGWFNDQILHFNLNIVKGNQGTIQFTTTENAPDRTTAGVPASNASLITTKLPVSYSDAQRGEGTTPPADTGNSDVPVPVPVQAQEISQTFNGNVIRIGAVIFIPGLIVIVILVVRSRQEKQRRSAKQLDHSAPTVHIRN